MITVKQANCFYRAYKEGKLNRFNADLIGLMYDIAKNGFRKNDIIGALFFEFQYKKLNEAMNALFANEYEKAEDSMFTFLTCGKFANLEQYLNL